MKEYLLEVWNTKAGARRAARGGVFIVGLILTHLAAQGYLGDAHIMSVLGPVLQGLALIIRGGDQNPEWLETLKPDGQGTVKP